MFDFIGICWCVSVERLVNMLVDLVGVKFVKWGYDMVRRLFEVGVGIMVGIDILIVFLILGYSLYEELWLLVNSGLMLI